MTADAPTKEAIEAWMHENRQGRKAAAEFFGITKADVNAIFAADPSRVRPSARTPGRTRAQEEAAAAIDMSPLEYRRYKLLQLEEYTIRIVRMKKDASTGVAALSKSAEKLRSEIDRLASLVPDELDGATPEEIREHLGTIMEGWENEHLELAFRVYADRHGGRVLFISDGGHQTEYDAEEGWRAVEAQ